MINNYMPREQIILIHIEINKALVIELHKYVKCLTNKHLLPIITSAPF